MKTKIITYFILFWFASQAVFMFYWPLYLYCQNGLKFYEMLALGCIILPASIFIIVNNNIIKKIATCLLWVYSINSSLKFEIKAKQFYAASQRVL